MDSRLTIKIGVENTTFQVIDNSPYENWVDSGDLDNQHNHAVIQRLIKVTTDNDNTLVDSSLSVADTIDKLRNPWEVQDLIDGLYYYQKLLLPTVGHTTDANEILWYDESDGLVYYYDTDTGETGQYNAVNDFDEIFAIVRKEYPDNCFYFDDYTFTMYSLIECYILMETERINNYLKNNCSGGCENVSNINNKLDILLAAIMVINYLISQGDFFEALRILEGLLACGGLCSEYQNKNINPCGCGTLREKIV